MYSSKNEQNGEPENDDGNSSTLTMEIDSWKTYCSFTGCYISARKMKIAQELLTLKENSSQLNHGDITQLLFILLTIHSRLDSKVLRTFYQRSVIILMSYLLVA